MIWERGFDWKRSLREVETQPVEWDPVAEQWNKYVQETAKRITREQGPYAVSEWIRTVKGGAPSGGN